ncbi:MAG: PH domain-containing protein [Patescibacteria group bacterium]|jgi:uncharacterized membrane protein YdbT with pleckstrin-like domain|nr:PH domain-containing protein [Patescibacteria group bacterium]
MSNQYFADQFEDEEVLFVFRKHPIIMRKGLIVASLGLLFPVLVVFVLTFIPSLTPSMNQFYFSLAVGLVLFIVGLFPGWITWYFSVFVVTDQRFIQITQEGFFKKSVIDIGMDKIQSVSYEVRGIEQTVLGYGTIVIQTYVGELVLRHIHHPQAIQKRLVHTLRELGMNANMANQQVDEQ